MAFIQTERGEYMRKKLTAVLLAATMLLTSGVTVFADRVDAVIDKLVVPVLPQLRDGLVRQLFLQRFCIFNCHLESS